MGIAKETLTGRPNLTVSRTPVGPAVAGEKGSVGDQALMDAVLIVGIAWVILLLLCFSLRSHNI